MAHNLLMLGKMSAATMLIATLLSTGAWSADVAAEPERFRGAYFGLSASTILGAQNGGTDVSFDSMLWGSAQAGWSFGDRFFHGPELEAGWWQYHLVDSEFPSSASSTVKFHCGLSYRLGVDLLRTNHVALFVSGRLTVGWIPISDPIDGALGEMYLQTDLMAGVRVDAGPMRVRFGLGPVAGVYQWMDFLQLQAGVAVEL